MVTASSTDGGKFLLGVENRTFSSPEYVEADYLLIASGNSKQVVIDWCPLYCHVDGLSLLICLHSQRRVTVLHLSLVIQL